MGPEEGLSQPGRHGVSFQEARTVFFDPHALVIDDPDHSQAEERFLIMGHSRAPRMLVVAHCYRSADGVIRIILARKATKHEATRYAEGERHGR